MPPSIALWWTKHGVTLILICLAVLAAMGVLSASYYAGKKAQASKVAAAEGSAAVSSTEDQNSKDALTQAAERHKVEVTIREIERESGSVIAEARITGSVNDALAGWAAGVDRLRLLDQAGPVPGDHQDPGMPR